MAIEKLNLESGVDGRELINKINEIIEEGPAVPTEGKVMAVLGDSIDVDGASPWHVTAKELLKLSEVLVIAKSGARHNDNEQGPTNINLTPSHLVASDNTLSNQVRNLIYRCYPKDEQITWTHPVTEEVVTIPTEYGLGLGQDPAPDIITIKFGQNGAHTALPNDDEVFETVISQNYLDLDRENQYSSMRWAIETLMINFPLAHIFVLTSIQTRSSYSLMKMRADMNIRMAKYMNCPVINLFEECGISQKFEPNGEGRYLYDGIHPGNGINSQYNGHVHIGRFIANRIAQYYIARQ